VKEFIRNLAPSQIDLLLEKGQSQLESMNWLEAGISFQQFLAKTPNQPAGMLGLLKSNLMQGFFLEAKQIIDEFPPSQEYTHMQLLRPLFDALTRKEADETIDEDTLDAVYRNALRLMMRGNLPAAMDGMMDILRQNKHYRNDEARKVMLGLFEVLGDNHPLTQQYRQELGMVLF
jgi:putative thioredoxin